MPIATVDGYAQMLDQAGGKAGEAGMGARVTHACEDLMSAGHHL
jgi:hypothetical protein